MNNTLIPSEHAPHGEPVAAVSADGGIDVRTTKAQVVGVRRRVRRRRPIVAARTAIVERARAVVASEQEIRERTWTCVSIKRRSVLVIATLKISTIGGSEFVEVAFLVAGG